MIKKKVLLINCTMMAGGIETALLSFIENMREEADIDLLLLNKSGMLYEKLPSDLNVVSAGKILKMLCGTYGEKTDAASTSKSKFKFKFIKFLKSMGAKKILQKFAYVGQKQKQHYDIAICFNAIHELCAGFVLKCVNADKKIGIVHCDISKQEHSKKNIKYISKFDKIVCVSNGCTEVFKQTYPKLDSKAICIYNFLDDEKVIKLSNETKVNYPKGINIVSVGRLAEEKGYIRALEVFKRLKDEGYNFNWHIIGGGLIKNKIEEKIKALDLDKNVHLHGTQKNPYPYIKAADFLALLSYHESFGLVAVESLICGKPVLMTNTVAAKEIVKKDYGIVCENNEEGIYVGLKQMLEGFKKFNIKGYKFNNDLVKKQWIEEIKK